MIAELLALTVMLGYTGYRTWQYTQDLTTKIGWYIYRQENTVSFTLETVSFTLENDNLYSDGCGALIKEFQSQLNWPQDIYVSNFFQIDFDHTGQITYMYAFLYGENESGELKSYLIDYDRSISTTVTVWIDDYVTASYDSDMLLQPMADIVDKIDLKARVEDISADSLGLLYYGKRGFTTGFSPEDAIMYLVSESGTLTQTVESTTGYEVSLYAPDNDTVLPQRFFADWMMDFPSSPSSGAMEENDIPEHEIGVSFLDANNDTQFFVDNQIGFRLRVVDAAAGSRFYVLDQTTDGGLSWSCVNEDPFAGKWGNYVNIVFYDESFGYLQLPSGSNDYCQLYRTEDGGATLTQVALPISSSSKYDYPYLPELDGDIMTLIVGTGLESDYSYDTITFVSNDLGVTWILQ